MKRPTSADIAIRGIAAGGSGIGDLPDGRVIFVPRTAPGDQARVRSVKNKAPWAVGPLERDHFDLAFQLLSVRNTTRWSPAVFDPPKGARNDADIILALASRLFRARGVSGRAI